MDQQPDREIHELLEQLNACSKDVKETASAYMQEYRAEALARPKRERVELLRALLKTKLSELLEAARQDGKV